MTPKRNDESSYRFPFGGVAPSGSVADYFGRDATRALYYYCNYNNRRIMVQSIKPRVFYKNIDVSLTARFFFPQVLYVGDSYVPVTTQLRSRPISPADSTVLDWRLQTVESWDGRRHGNNKTRVQREYKFDKSHCSRFFRRVFALLSYPSRCVCFSSD